MLIQKHLEHRELPFTVEAYHVSVRGNGTNSVCEATIKVRVKDEFSHTVAEGDGPVNALDGALRLALSKFFPQLDKLRLVDYKVRILDSAVIRATLGELQARGGRTKEIAQQMREEAFGTAARTRVLIQSTDGEKEWGTVGVSENIITASLQALADSMEYALMKK